MRPQPSSLWLAIAFIFFSSLNSNGFVTAQQNVTVQDTDSLIQYSPNCPSDQQVCNGGWTHFFLEGSGNTVGYKETFAPGAEFGFALPRATLTFRGSAVYWYTVIWRDTTLAAVSLDNSTPEIIDLSARYGLVYATPMRAGVLAWSKTGLDPNVDHTIVIQYAGPSGALQGTAAVRIDYIVFTSTQPIVSTPSTPTIPLTNSAAITSTIPSATRPTLSTSFSASTSATSEMAPAYASHDRPPPTGMVVGLVIGGAFALGLLLLLIFWCHHRRKVRKEELRGGIDSPPSVKYGFYRGELPVKRPSQRSATRRTKVQPHHSGQHAPRDRLPIIGPPMFQQHPPPMPPLPSLPPQPILINPLPPMHPPPQMHMRPPHPHMIQPPLNYLPAPGPEGILAPPTPGMPMDDDGWGTHDNGQPYQLPVFDDSVESQTTNSSLRVDTIEELGDQPINYHPNAPTPVPVQQQQTLTGITYIPAYPSGVTSPMMSRGPPIQQVFSGMPPGGDLRMPMTMPVPMHRYSTLRTVPEGGSEGSNGNGGRRW